MSAAPPTHARLARCLGEREPIVVDRRTAVTAHAALTELRDQVRSALAAVEDGTEGRCRLCGEGIPEGRLQARPWATSCVRHG